MHRHTEDIREAPVTEIMSTDFETMHEETTIHELLKTFEKHERAAFPVVSEDEGFVGDVHERDLMKLAIDPDKLNEHEIIGYMGTTVDRSYFANGVEDIMETHEVTASPDDQVEMIVLEMWNEDIRAVPVIEDGAVIGMVYEKDIIENVVEELKEVR